jgi:hypothetical protein
MITIGSELQELKYSWVGSLFFRVIIIVSASHKIMYLFLSVTLV